MKVWGAYIQVHIIVEILRYSPYALSYIINFFFWIQLRFAYYILVPPNITQGPGHVYGISSQQFSLTCTATGVPPPMYEWHKVSNTWQPLSHFHCIRGH